MDSTITYISILFEILAYTHEKVHKKMKSIIYKFQDGNSEGFMLTMSFTFQWFVCLFTNSNIKKNIQVIIMDYFIMEGVIALFKASLAIFDYL
jgi:hypothetical protein